MVRPIRSAAISLALLSLAVLAQTLPAAAQSVGGYGAQTCRNVRGQLVCSNAPPSRGAPGAHAYERWSDGSPAVGSGSAPDAYRYPQYLGGHNAWYGLGR